MRRGASLVLNVMFFVCTFTAGAAVGGPMIPVLLGYRTMIVVSGSMEPDIGVGDALVIHRQAPEEIRVGDVITFQPFGAQELKTHRVIAIERIDGHLYFQTKGDANDTPDPDLADSDAVVGTVRMHVPNVGRFLLYSTHPRVQLVLIGLPAFLLMLQQLVALRGARGGGSGAVPQSPRGPTPPRDRGARVVAYSWLPVLVIAAAIVHGAGVSTSPERTAAVYTDSTLVGGNTFSTAPQFAP
jgi:signal peptidase